MLPVFGQLSERFEFGPKENLHVAATAAVDVRVALCV